MQPLGTIRNLKPLAMGELKAIPAVNVVVNGGFDSADNWTNYESTNWFINNGVARATLSNATFGLTQAGIFDIDKNYLITFTVTDYSGSGDIGILGADEGSVAGNGTFQFHLFAGIFTDLIFSTYQYNGKMDNVSAYEF